jgi:hypothetical protein
MTTLFPLDQAQNDRLLLQEAQRKQDLIDFATRRFAPHLTDNPDVRVLHLYSTNASLRKLIRENFKSVKTVVVEHCSTTFGKERSGVNEVQHEGVFIPLPNTADFVATKSALNSKTEWLAARLQALPIVLPEALGYLSRALDKKHALTIVGAEQAK